MTTLREIRPASSERPRESMRAPEHILFKGMANMLKEKVVFAREFIQEFQYTGSMCATSRWAAEALTYPLRERSRPLRILELGPGTGSVTVRILRYMRPEDSLTICEINPRFMKSLKDRLAENPDFIAHKDRISFFLGAAQHIEESQDYDVIICALPFLNFDRTTVEEIFAKLESISHNETVLTHYEYIGLRVLNKIIASPKRRQRMKDIESFFRAVDREHRQHVWLNALPIHVYSLKMGNTAAAL